MPETRLDNAGLLMKKILLKICIYATIICVLVSVFASPAFATGDVVQFTEAAKLGATVIDLYGMANNTSLAYDVASSGSALTVIENLYQDYATNASDPYTLAAIGAALAAAGAVAVVYDAVTGKGYIQLYQEQYISSMDGYWDYQLAQAGFNRDPETNLYEWSKNQNDSVDNIIISNFSYMSVGPYVIYSASSYGNDIVYFYSPTNNLNTTNTYIYGYLNNDTVYFIPIIYDYQNTTANFWLKYGRNGSSFQINNGNPTGNSWNYKNRIIYWYNQSTSLKSSNNIPNPILSISPNDLFNQYYNDITIDGDKVELSPYWGDPLNNPLEITIPDNTAPDYVPTPRRITTNIPWDPSWGDPLPDGVSEPEYGVPYPITDPALLNTVVPEIWDDLVANDVQVQQNPQPSDPDTPTEEVYLPFLPLEVPSFNFSLSGIWHYVITWVQSLGSWFTALFAMWSCLPYAMVVPVYATLVVVIVLGLYKRFIA